MIPTLPPLDRRSAGPSVERSGSRTSPAPRARPAVSASPKTEAETKREMGVQKMNRIGTMFVIALLLPAAAFAQAAISGVVRDASGAVLPGVTVEATSPALIEKVRSTVTDGTGQYVIENLRPGEYTVTFTLPGFSVVRREGVALQGTFNARINADLQIGRAHV